MLIHPHMCSMTTSTGIELISIPATMKGFLPQWSLRRLGGGVRKEKEGRGQDVPMSSHLRCPTSGEKRNERTEPDTKEAHDPQTTASACASRQSSGTSSGVKSCEHTHM